jgi:hypothetical protein
MADLTQRIGRKEVLVSTVMIAKTLNNSWSELLTGLLSPVEFTKRPELSTAPEDQLARNRL